MGYLDYAGLQYLWSKLKEKFAPKSHSHDDRYYTESEMDGKLNSKVNNNETGANGLLSKLTTSWTATPTDNTYFIRQDTGGGNSFGRVKFSTIWNYIKGKTDGIYQPKGSYAASSHTHDDRYYTESEMNTKLSAKSENIVLSSDTNLNNITTPGFYSCGGGNKITNKPNNTDAIGLIVTHNASGGYYTQILTTSSNANTYRRTCLNGTWSGWTQDKYTDTNTWRGIQNNLTSDSTSDSLSAAQGKALKALVDGKLDKNEKAVDSAKLGGFPLNDIKKYFNGVPSIRNDGVMEVGKYIDFHTTSDDTSDYAARITAEKTGLTISGTTKGTFSGSLSGNASTATSATTASKLSTSAGSATQPVYFKDGVPVATTYTLNKTVPADAKFTDTNTWRGIQNNLTSDSADQSLSAAQGKVLKGMVDGKLGKNDKATSAATADKAAKLTTARTVSGGSDITLSFNYDGSGNSTANIGFYSCKHSIGNTNNYPFHRFAKLDVNKSALVDHSMTFLISQDYSGGGYGICRLVYRSNADSGNASVDAQWLVRRWFSADTIQVAIKTDKTNGAYCDAFYKSSGTYMGVVIRAIASGGRATLGRTWTLVNSNETDGTTATDKKTSSECWKTIAEAGTAIHKQAYSSSAPAKDEGYVASAGSANTSSSCTGNSASATKLTSSAGSATQPVYFKDGKPVAGTYTLCDASSKMVRTLSAQGNSGWANQTTDDKYVPTMSFMAYWNGAYGGTSSNLQYCDRGRFGTIVTKSTADFAPASGSNNYVRVWSSGTISGTDNASINDLAKQHFAMAMVNNATDNPLGAKKWIHAINMAWNNGVNSSWVSQIALGVQDSYGMWFRTGQGAIAGRAWNRVYDSSYHPNADHASAADSATNATNATTATKLSSNAGSSVQPVYFSGGKPVAIGYTISSSVPANAKFTDTTYGVASSSSNGLMSSTDKTKLDDFSRVINIQKQIKLTTDWQDTGIAGNSLDTGTYVVQVSGFNSSYTQLYSEIYSGVMSWYSGTTNSGNSSEIFLHNAGLADNNNAIYLRTLRVAGSKTLKLQIACKVAATGTDILTFKFRRLI